MRRFWWLAALAVALAGVAAVPFHQGRSERGKSGSAEWAAALGDRRLIEPRLSGGFGYASCETFEESGRLLPRTRCSPPPPLEILKTIEDRIPRSEEVRRGHSTQRGGMAGWELLVRAGHDPDTLRKAVRAFEDAAEESPADAKALSDLAAVRFAWAAEKDDPSGLVRALDEVRRALRIDPSLPEARFNDALILERLHLRDQAAAAWRIFRDADRKSEWAREAQTHLNRLEGPLAPDLWKEKQPQLRAAAFNSDAATVRKIVAASPQDAREQALETLLGAWGDALLGGEPEKAEESLVLARAMGEALRETTGESSVAGAVGAIDRAAAAGRVADLRALARGHVAYRDGIASLQQENTDGPAKLLEEAQVRLAQGRSPAEAWARLSLAGINIRLSHYDEAIEGYSDLAGHAELAESPALQGKAEWGIGLSHVRQGHYSEALAHYRTAAAHFKQAREALHLGFVSELVAECLRFLGQRGAAWQSRFQAAKALHPYRGSVRFHNVLWEGGWAAAEDGLPEAGLAFLDEGVALAEKSHLPQRLAEALLWRSKVHLAEGDLNAALNDLATAKGSASEVAEPRLRDRLAADLAYVEGEARRIEEPLPASLAYTEAVDYYQRNALDLDLAGALLGRFQASRAAGQVQAAEQDLTAAIDLFEQQRDRLSEAGSRVIYTETSQKLYDAMILLQAEDKADAEAALDYSERARTVALGPQWALQPRRIADSLTQIPGDVAIVEYALIQDRLFTWVAWKGQIQSFQQEVAGSWFEYGVRRFSAAIEGREPETRVNALARSLYTILIPPPIEALPGNVKLAFVPDKALNLVPFAALRNPRTGRYLIEDRSIRIVPGMTFPEAARESSQRASSPSALLVGATDFDRKLFQDLPSLPGAEAEISTVGRIYRDPLVIQGAEATKDRVLTEMDRHEIFHFAGHSAFNEQHPDHSYFVLAPSLGEGDGGLLLMSEIAEKRFERLRLVVLSSCRSLGAQETRVAGISGLARPFLDSGVEAVVGSLWNVGDKAASVLIPEFHRRYLASGDAAESLRGAQLAMLRSGDPSLQAPDAWAVFLIVGR